MFVTLCLVVINCSCTTPPKHEPSKRRPQERLNDIYYIRLPACLMTSAIRSQLKRRWWTTKRRHSVDGTQSTARTISYQTATIRSPSIKNIDQRFPNKPWQSFLSNSPRISLFRSRIKYSHTCNTSSAGGWDTPEGANVIERTCRNRRIYGDCAATRRNAILWRSKRHLAAAAAAAVAAVAAKSIAPSAGVVARCPVATRTVAGNNDKMTKRTCVQRCLEVGVDVSVSPSGDG